jgi:hypothetical protein
LVTESLTCGVLLTVGTSPALISPRTGNPPEPIVVFPFESRTLAEYTILGTVVGMSVNTPPASKATVINKREITIPPLIHPHLH